MKELKKSGLLLLMLLVLMLSACTGCSSQTDNKVTQDQISNGEQGAYTELFEYDGLEMSVGQNYMDEESGNYMIDVHGANNSDKNYSFRVEAVVNGYPVHSYQSLILASGNQAGYGYAIPTTVLREYGINDIGQVDYKIIVNEFDMENFKTGEQAFVSDTYTIKTEKYDSFDTVEISDEPVYEDKNIAYHVITEEGPAYAHMNVFAANLSDNDAEVVISEMYLNGEAMNIESTAEVYTLSLEGNNCKFAFLPIQNYEWDEEKAETIVHPVETLEIRLTITCGEESYTTDRFSCGIS